MKKYIANLLVITALLFNSCSSGQNNGVKTNLSATEFSEKLKEYPEATILDVRTPGEYSEGHLENSKNVNWNSRDFKTEVEKLDKTKPVFVYCLSGGRSSSAASYLRSNGFAMVYEMDGGMMKWRSANLPETTNNTVKKDLGMSREQYDALLDTSKMVLVDFYAEWCAPCKKMKPYLDEIAKEYGDKVIIVRIDTEKHPGIANELKIDAIPVLMLYKNKVLTWTNVGYIEKSEVLKKLEI